MSAVAEISEAVTDLVTTLPLGVYCDPRPPREDLEPVINFAHRVFVKKCLYIVYTFRHYARDETDAKELSE